ncbi:MAG: NTP transferase domain-containing protein, partial [Pseudomonadota bacterium]
MTLATADSSRSCPVVILADGGSTRFGRPKSEAFLCNKPLIEWVFERIRAQTDAPILINASAQIKTAADAPYLPDLLGPDLGPLAGIHAGLEWANANGYKSIATERDEKPFFFEIAFFVGDC